MNGVKSGGEGGPVDTPPPPPMPSCPLFRLMPFRVNKDGGKMTKLKRNKWFSIYRVVSTCAKIYFRATDSPSQVRFDSDKLMFKWTKQMSLYIRSKRPNSKVSCHGRACAAIPANSILFSAGNFLNRRSLSNGCTSFRK